MISGAVIAVAGFVLLTVVAGFQWTNPVVLGAFPAWVLGGWLGGALYSLIRSPDYEPYCEQYPTQLFFGLNPRGD